LPMLAWTLILLFMLPTVAEITGEHYHTRLFSFEMGSHELFAQDGLEL
jgi:hypothetical protein